MEELKRRDGDGLRGSTKAAGLKTGTREEDRLSLLNIAKFEGGTGKIQAPSKPKTTQTATGAAVGADKQPPTKTSGAVENCSRPACLVAGRGRDQPCIPQPSAHPSSLPPERAQPGSETRGVGRSPTAARQESDGDQTVNSTMPKNRTSEDVIPKETPKTTGA